MSYDPEFSLQLETTIHEMAESLAEARFAFGDDHPIVRLYERFDVCFAQVEQQLNDYQECYDPDRKEELRIAALQSLAALTEQYQKAIAVLERHMAEV